VEFNFLILSLFSKSKEKLATIQHTVCDISASKLSFFFCVYRYDDKDNKPVFLIVAGFVIPNGPTEQKEETAAAEEPTGEDREKEKERRAERSAHDTQPFHCKCFGFQAEKLLGFTAKQLVDLENSEDFSAIDDMFDRVNYSSVWSLVVKIAETSTRASTTKQRKGKLSKQHSCPVKHRSRACCLHLNTFMLNSSAYYRSLYFEHLFVLINEL